jgi:cytidylate kinase
MKDKISLAGDLGSGKSTVSEVLISRLGAEYYSTGAIVRSIAASKGMTVTELNKYMETHPEIDHEIDDGLKALSEVDKLLIIDSRMAWHFTKGTFKVYLSCDPETSATRIMGADRIGEGAESLAEAIKNTMDRRESEKKRYMTQYGVDIKDLMNYDLVVDTTCATPEEIADRIIESFEEWKKNREYKAAFICPTRLFYPDDEPEIDHVTGLSALLEMGIEIPEVRAVEKNGEFYVTANVESALAYGFNFATFVPVTLTRGDIDEKNFTNMKNNL